MMFSSGPSGISLLDLLNTTNCQIESVLDFDDIINTFRSDSLELLKLYFLTVLQMKK